MVFYECEVCEKGFNKNKKLKREIIELKQQNKILVLEEEIRKIKKQEQELKREIIELKQQNKILVLEEEINKLKNACIQQTDTEKIKGKKQSIPKVLKSIVWNHWIKDKNNPKCWCCESQDLDPCYFHCGHVIPESKGGELTLENMRPICGFCNSSMGTMNMLEFKKKIKSFFHVH